jgi:lantibiotic biosynthesis protein
MDKQRDATSVPGPLSRRDIVDLGATVLSDAVRLADDRDNLGLHLDIAACMLDYERIGGPDLGPERHLLAAVDIVRGRHDVGPWLFNGVAHLGWLATLMNGLGRLTATNTGWMDDYVISWLESYPATLDVDLPQGILGLGVYGLAHDSPAVGETIGRAVLAVLDERLERAGDLAFLRCVNPDRAQLTERYVVGHRDLGVAHGNLGVAAYLALLATSGRRCAPGALPLLAPLARWLRTMVRPDQDGVFGPTAEQRWQPARAAWCYGDPGASVALALAADALDDPALDDPALATACRGAARRAALTSLRRPCVPLPRRGRPVLLRSPVDRPARSSRPRLRRGLGRLHQRPATAGPPALPAIPRSGA